MIEAARLARETGRSIDAMPKIRSEDNLIRSSDLRLAVIAERSGGKNSEFSKYYIQVGPRKAYGVPTPHLGARNAFDDGILVTLKRIPKVWESDLNDHYKQYRISLDSEMVAVAAVGSIEYIIPKADQLRTAFTLRYNPRGCLGRKRATRIPYFLETLTTFHLKIHGIEYISTTKDPDPHRVKQLERVELPVNERVGVNDWLMGLGRGIRSYIEHPEKSELRAQPQLTAYAQRIILAK